MLNNKIPEKRLFELWSLLYFFPLAIESGRKRKFVYKQQTGGEKSCSCCSWMQKVICGKNVPNIKETDNWYALYTLLVLSIVFPSYENYLPFSWLFWPDMSFYNNREGKHDIYVKRQTRLCTTWPSFPITCRLVFIISTHKLVVSRNFLSTRIVLSCFYFLIFYF